jgi:hypothetical protein
MWSQATEAMGSGTTLQVFQHTLSIQAEFARVHDKKVRAGRFYLGIGPY